MTNYSPDYFIHAANILLLVAYSVRDILWLRLFAVAASVVSIPYFLLQPATLWAPLAWTVVLQESTCCNHGASSWSVDPSN